MSDRNSDGSNSTYGGSNPPAAPYYVYLDTRLWHSIRAELAEWTAQQKNYTTDSRTIRPVELPECESLREFLHTLRAEPVLAEIYVRPPGGEGRVHRDGGAGTAYQWSINIPLEGWRGTRTDFWLPRTGPTHENGIWCWERHNCWHRSSHPTLAPFAMDTGVPHSVHNLDSTRITLLLRMHTAWRPPQTKN